MKTVRIDIYMNDDDVGEIFLGTVETQEGTELLIEDEWAAFKEGAEEEDKDWDKDWGDFVRHLSETLPDTSVVAPNERLILDR